MPLRLVLDTSVLVAAIRSNRGASNALVEAGLLRKYTVIITANLFFEYEAVMTRPEHLAASGLDVNDVVALLDELAAVAEKVHPSYLWRPQLSDPDDEMVLEAAINGRAHAIVTFNASDFGMTPKRFGTAILSPAEALQKLRTV